MKLIKWAKGTYKGHKTQFDVEIQRDKRGATLKRSLFHSALMMGDDLDTGDDFDNLSDIYTVFLSEHDITGSGLPIFRKDITLGGPGDEGLHIIYLNLDQKYDIDTLVGKVIHDVQCTNPDDMLLEPFRRNAHKLKNTKEGRAKMVEEIESFYDRGRDEGRKEGRDEGMKEEKIANLKSMAALGLSYEMLSQGFHIPIDDIRTMLATV